MSQHRPVSVIISTWEFSCALPFLNHRPVSRTVILQHNNHTSTHSYLVVPRSRTERYRRCFWSHFVEHTATDRAWPITDTDSVLCALEDCDILHSLWNTATGPPWQFRL